LLNPKKREGKKPGIGEGKPSPARRIRVFEKRGVRVQERRGKLARSSKPSNFRTKRTSERARALPRGVQVVVGKFQLRDAKKKSHQKREPKAERNPVRGRQHTKRSGKKKTR